MTSPCTPVLLSTSSVFPEPTSAAFEMAATLGYDGVEVMVWTDPVSQDAGALKVPVRPLRRAGRLGARALPAGHPAGVEPRPVGAAAPLGGARHRARRADRSSCTRRSPGSASTRAASAPGWPRCTSEFPDIAFAVENMYPVRVRGREFVPYAPGWDPTQAGFDAYTLDLSHCAAARNDALAMADAMGAGLAHVHLGDGTGEGRDEHLVPGRGTQPCAELLASLGGRGFTGSVAVEVATRRARSRAGARPTWPRRSPSPASTWPRRPQWIAPPADRTLRRDTDVAATAAGSRVVRTAPLDARRPCGPGR